MMRPLPGVDAGLVLFGSGFCAVLLTAGLTAAFGCAALTARAISSSALINSSTRSGSQNSGS